MYRHAPPASARKVEVQGYGVELLLKNMEYKAVDDSNKPPADPAAASAGEQPVPADEVVEGFAFARLLERKPALNAELRTFRDSLAGASDLQLEKLKVWELKDVGVQATQRIMAAAHPVALLRDISQNFPTLLSSLTRVVVNDSVREQISRNQQVRMHGNPLLLLNGRVLNADTLDPFQLVEAVADETAKFERLRQLHVVPRDAMRIMSQPSGGAAAPQYRFDLRSPVVQWVADLEAEPGYRAWPRDVSALLRGGWPGQPRFVARNFMNVLLMGDFSSSDLIEACMYTFSYLRQNLPAHVGLVFHTTGDLHSLDQGLSVAVAKAFLRIKDASRDFRTPLRFLASLQGMGGATVSNLAELLPNFPNGDVDLLTLVQDTTHDALLQQSNAFLLEKGLVDMLPAISNNGKLLLDPSSKLHERLVSDTLDYQEAVMHVSHGHITDSTNILDFYSEKPDVLNAYSPLLFVQPKNPLRVLQLAVTPEPAQRTWEELSAEGKTARILESRRYVCGPAALDEMQQISYLLPLDLSSPTLLRAARNLLVRLQQNPALPVRVGFLSVGEADAREHELAALLATQRPSRLLGLVADWVAQLLHEEAADADALKIARESVKKYLAEHAAALAQQSAHDRLFYQEVLHPQAEHSALLVNGRVLELPMARAALSVSEWDLLEMYERRERVERVWPQLMELAFEGVDADLQTSDFRTDVCMRVISLLATDQERGLEKAAVPHGLQASFEYNSEDSNDGVAVFAVLDPLSKPAQRVSALLVALLQHVRVHVRVVLSPNVQVSDLPLKSYYRYAMNDLALDSPAGAPAAGCVFNSLPRTRMLSMIVDTPEAWLVRAVVAKYDTDNIKLEDITADRMLYAQFELQQILVQGQCVDSRTGVPPRGLELYLSAPGRPHVQDTLVMSNLGYFQLKANPNRWRLELAPGRASELYEIESLQLRSRTGKLHQGAFELGSWHGVWLQLGVAKRPGMEDEGLLDAPADTTSLLSSLSGLWGGGKAAADKHETIHVFSVATGHLYERFLRIMILSVLRNTKNPVKFWFLANYLSPKLIDYLPVMAQKYRFEYELVTYKWPAWLLKQTDKQRIIWGYKMLFLDVLFPLSVKRIIYVDADQIVRADLRELYDMDLDGAPYGFTPFCNERPDMDGYKFWIRGFWQEHLKGLPYHISALYVVDLVQLRRMGAADRLRGTYDSLARDPNSLANLDQDLPNFLQHDVPIHSLPQEWLWCETWCDSSTKARAKTIDLCNNPQTKIPKLENAHRVIGPYWKELDDEARSLEPEVDARRAAARAAASAAASSRLVQQQQQQQQQQLEQIKADVL